MDDYELIKYSDSTTGVVTARDNISSVSEYQIESSVYSTYEQLDTGTFLLDSNIDLSVRRLKIPLNVEKFSTTQFNQVVNIDFQEFIPISSTVSNTSSESLVNIDTLLNMDSVNSEISSELVDLSGNAVTISSQVPITWSDPVNVVIVSATPEYFLYTINDIQYTGNDIESIANNRPYFVFFDLRESDIARLNSLYAYSILRPIIDMIFAYNDWYINPRIINSTSYPSTNSTSSPMM